MTTYFIVFISQLAFNIFKVLEIKYTYQNKITSLMINSVFINLVALMGVYYSLGALLNDDFWVIVFYLIGSIIGKYIGIKWNTSLFSLFAKMFKK